MTGAAGIIANPAAGKDIRRLVAHASVFDTDEKINIIRRVILGLEAAGTRRVLYMPDPSQMVRRAADGLDVALELAPVDGTYRALPADTTVAAAAMAAEGVDVIVSLGGDGTNRALAKGAADVPLIPISTGTNNVFPVMVEGTVAGLAAGAVACAAVDPDTVAQRCKLIEIVTPTGARPHGGQVTAAKDREIALIDVMVMAGQFVGSRAIWELDGVREVLLTQAMPNAIGMSAAGGMVVSVTPDDDFGLRLKIGAGESVVVAAIAPGLVRDVPLAGVERIEFGAIVPVTGPALLALDGEREFSIRAQESVTMTLSRTGPPVVDIGRCLAAARDAGFLRREL